MGDDNKSYHVSERMVFGSGDGMKTTVWLTDKKSLMSYMRDNGIFLKYVFKNVMLKRGGRAGKGIAISFLFKDVPGTPQGDPKIFKYRPASRFTGVTKRKALLLLGLTSDSSVEDCERINMELEKRNGEI